MEHVINTSVEKSVSFFITPHLSCQVTTASNSINTETSTSCIQDFPVLFIFSHTNFSSPVSNVFILEILIYIIHVKKIVLIYESELYSNAQFLLFLTSKIRFEMQMRSWWQGSYSYLIRRWLLLQFLGMKITTQALKYSCCAKILRLFWSQQEIILLLAIPH